ncbi:hypothetical protein ATO4_10604 [Aurantimonas sp. 22II-16-19i]|nr:hypothetical protein ATO4_10604 [Aurantimonas sp. 22II-16-19i]
MRFNPRRHTWRIICVATVFATIATPGSAGVDLPVPRFVSLKASKANVRSGPSLSYQISWVYVRSGIPLEIYQEFGNWRRIRGMDGKSGWINGALLSGRRTAQVASWAQTPVPLYAAPDKRSAVDAKLEQGVILNDLSCDGRWCAVAVRQAQINGYLRQRVLWGVYPNEKINQASQSWLSQVMEIFGNVF